MLIPISTVTPQEVAKPKAISSITREIAFQNAMSYWDCCPSLSPQIRSGSAGNTTVMSPRAERAIRIVFAVPPGEELTQEEWMTQVRAVEDAAAYWESTYAGSPDFNVRASDTISVSVSDDVYATLTWSIPYTQQRDDGTILVGIIDNSSSKRLYYTAIGVALEEWNAAYVIGTGLEGENGLTAAIAHELGHVVFHLPDIRPFGSTRDIMSDPLWAYNNHVIGMQTLASLGIHPRVYVPLGGL
jgi:hypothetical protein